MNEVLLGLRMQLWHDFKSYFKSQIMKATNSVNYCQLSLDALHYQNIIINSIINQLKVWFEYCWSNLSCRSPDPPILMHACMHHTGHLVVLCMRLVSYSTLQAQEPDSRGLLSTSWQNWSYQGNHSWMELWGFERNQCYGDHRSTMVCSVDQFNHVIL